MKIGILTMQRVINYGSFLQAFALKAILEDMGHECSFIDIEPGKKIIKNYKKTNIITIFTFIAKRLDKNFLNRIKHQFFIKARKKRYHNEFFPILGLNKEPNYKSSYDAIVIGSDEVFNCTQNVSWGFAKTLLGEGLDSELIITYAASCGHTTLENLEEYNIYKEAKVAMSNLKVISVRDSNTKQFANRLTDKVIYEHLDPTLLYDFKPLLPDLVFKKRYLLVYSYDGRLNDKETITKIKEFAEKEKMNVICIGYQSWCNKNILCNPFELLSYFMGADYIVTDTFHGTVFSIKYNKQFATIVRDSNKQKVLDILNRFNLNKRLVSSLSSIEQILLTPIYYNDICKIIERQKELTYKYFEENLNTH